MVNRFYIGESYHLHPDGLFYSATECAVCPYACKDLGPKLVVTGVDRETGTVTLDTLG